MTDPIPLRRRPVDQRLGLRDPGNPGAGTTAIQLPRIILILVAAICVVSVFQFLSPSRLSLTMDYTLGFVPAKLTRGLSGDVPAWSLFLPMLTHIFLHGNIAHLLFNMLMLTVFGAGVARRLHTERGPVPDRVINVSLFIAFFLACGAAGAAAYLAREPDSVTPMIGASGAISGLMAASMRFALRRLAPYGVAHGPLAGIFEGPVLIASALYIGINIATAFGAGIGTGDAIVAWDAHIGGYVFGLVTFPLFDRFARRGPGPSANVGPRTLH